MHVSLTLGCVSSDILSESFNKKNKNFNSIKKFIYAEMYLSTKLILSFQTKALNQKVYKILI